MTQSPATLASPAQAPLRRWLALATLALSAGLSAAPAAAGDHVIQCHPDDFYFLYWFIWPVSFIC